MDKQERFDRLADKLIDLLPTEVAYQEMISFLGYANKSFDANDPDYFEKQANVIETAATTLWNARERMFAERTAQAEQYKKAARAGDNAGLFFWPGWKEPQA